MIQDEAAGLSRPSSTSSELLRYANDLRIEFGETADDLQRATGIPEELFEELERAQLPFREDRYDLQEVLEVPSTGDLDADAGIGLENLRSVVDPDWLRSEAAKDHRLDESYLHAPLHLVSGLRVHNLDQRPQRLAQMLLVTADNLDKRPDLDFFEAPMLVGEVAALGPRLNDVRGLGSEAVSKLAALRA